MFANLNKPARSFSKDDFLSKHRTVMQYFSISIGFCNFRSRQSFVGLPRSRKTLPRSFQGIGDCVFSYDATRQLLK